MKADYFLFFTCCYYNNKMKYLYFSFFLLSEREDAVQNFRVTDRKTKTVRLSWKAPKKPNIRSYTVSSL